MRKCESPSFVLFKGYLVILSPLRFHMNFRIVVSVSETNTVGVLIEIALNMYIILGRCTSYYVYI